MKYPFYYLIIITGLSSLNAQAQTQIVKKAIQKIGQYKNMSYTQIEKQKSPFSDDITTLSVKSNVSRNYNQVKSVELFLMEESRGYKYVSNGFIRMDLDLNNKTYEIKDISKNETYYSNEPYYSPYYWLKFMQEKLNTSPEKIKELSDTIINHTACYHLNLPLTDSGTSREIYDLYLNKITYLPIYTKLFLRGKFGKGDMTSDVIATMINEETYSNYNINSKKFPNITDIKIPSDFKPERKLALILPGKKSPDWKLEDLQGNNFSNTQLLGNITLIDFSFNACAACMLSIPSLKRLHEKYKDRNVKTLSINIADTKESVTRFVDKNNINYPVLINGKNTSKIFKVSAYPTFYLIDKQGNIVIAIEGYSNELEKKLTAEIEKLM